MIANTLEKVLKTQAGSIDRPYKEVKEMPVMRKENGREEIGVPFNLETAVGHKTAVLDIVAHSEIKKS